MIVLGCVTDYAKHVTGCIPVMPQILTSFKDSNWLHTECNGLYSAYFFIFRNCNHTETQFKHNNQLRSELIEYHTIWHHLNNNLTPQVHHNVSSFNQHMITTLKQIFHGKLHQNSAI